MSNYQKHEKVRAVETLERRQYLSSDIQIVPLHGAFCHCVGCACAKDAQNQAVEVGLEPQSLSRAAISAAQRIGFFRPEGVASSIATVLPMPAVADAVLNEGAEGSGNVSSAVSSFSTKINFQPASASVPSGYKADSGKIYGDRGNGLTYGWNSTQSDAYDRNSSKSPDQRYDTLIKMSSSDVWQIQVPNGWYDVSVYAGDAFTAGADLRMNVEGQLALWTKLHYADKRFGEGHIKVQVKDGKLTVSTGSGASKNAIAHIDIKAASAPKSYQYVNNISWSSSSSVSSPIGRVEAGVVRVGDKMYFIGGYTNGYYSVSKRVDIYDIKSNKWSRGEDVPGAQTHAGATTDGRYIYWAAGQYGALYSRQGTNEVWRYDTQEDEWSRYANLPEVRFGGGLAYVDGTLVFFGGATSDRNTASAKAWKLDTTQSDADWQSIASMPRAADHLGHAEVNGIVYAIGGEHDHGNSYVQHADVFAYNIETNTWSRKADMPTASSHFEGNVVGYKGRLYVFAGQVDAQLLSSEVRSYDPDTNTWVRHNNMPEQRKGGGGWVHNDKFYYLTGDAWKKGNPTYALIGTVTTSVSVPGGSTGGGGTTTPPPSGNGGSSISGFLWNDGDNDGIVDASEERTGIRTVYLDNNRNGKLDSGEKSTQSDAQGNYKFSNLSAGTYFVSRVFPSPYRLSNDANGYITVNLGTSQIISDVHLGATRAPLLAPPPSTGTGGSISGFLFNDADKDGIPDATENRTGVRTVFLDTNQNGRLDSGEKSTRSDGQGNYKFSNLSNGTYFVTRVFPSGFWLSNNNSGYVVAVIDDSDVTVHLGSRSA